MNGRILIIDDEPIAVKNLAYALRKDNHEVLTCESGSSGIKIFEQNMFDVILTDLRMTDIDGMAVLSRAVALYPNIAVILITAHGSFSSVVEAMKAGAFHYIAKPFRIEEVRLIVKNALKIVQVKRENILLRKTVDETAIPRFITQEPGISKLLETARQVASTTSNILITGESGTGKELLAKYIHYHSNRKNNAFIAVNCAALQEDLLTNELFGHKKGAYTGANENHQGLIEAANKGTLFLDEIGEMSLGMQVKLLRVIQEREIQPLGETKSISVDIRILAATHRDLQNEVAKKRFRHDLYYRIDVIQLHIPPLIERRNDIPLLAHYFLRRHALRMGRHVEAIHDDAVEVLSSYDYPGNIRELDNIIERGVALTLGDELISDDLPTSLRNQAINVVRKTGEKLPSLDEREMDYIRYVLKHCDDNKTQAAKILGIDRVSLWRKLKKYNL